MQKPPTWRDLLGDIIRDPHEKQRIANELGVSPITLARWVSHQANPRPQNLRQLLKVTPQHRNLLFELIAVEFPAFSMTTGNSLIEEPSQEIPSGFYARVLKAYSTTPKLQRFWSISSLILQQALGQLDPNQLGMLITVAQCTPPVDAKKVRSLRERTGLGTPPWNTNLDERTIFLGLESLAGYAVTSSRPLTIENRDEHVQFPAQWIEWERSATVCPIMREDRTAGCLLASSTQPGYFLPFRETLLQNYAELMILAFEPEEFYAPRNIELHLMPSDQAQKLHFSRFRKQVSEVMLEATRNRRPINLLAAEELVWQQLEEELLELPVSTGNEIVQ